MPACESILEEPEDALIDGCDNHSSEEEEHHHSHHASMRAHSGRERERSRRTHHGTATGSRHSAKPRSKTTDWQRPSAIAAKDNRSDWSRRRHKRSQSGKSGSSSGSTSSDEEESTQDHRAVLAAARARLSSPSTISAFTTATHNSGGSSSSNSTVTQDSVTKGAGKKPEEEAPLSPAAPDPPDVFAFLEKDDSEPEDRDEDDHHEEDDQDEETRDEETRDTEVDDPSNNHGGFPPSWASRPEMSLTTTGPPRNHNSGPSSASSSFHGDDTFSQPADHDTDRSDSPDRIDEKDEAAPAPPPTDRVSAKVAAQIAAAQERQNLYAMQQFGTPNMPRGNYQHPFVPPSALSARYQQQVKPHALPRAEKIPVTGYEKLASRLSYSREAEERGERIRPMYRKFEALNHRILLHLQDEISELEEQLRRLDNADTQSRRTDRYIVPASRRAAAQAGGELQWHKTDVLGRIGYKLTQYSISFFFPNPSPIH